MAASTAPGTPWHDSWLHLEEKLAERPDLEWEPRFYLGGQLGSEESALSQLRRGRIQVGGFSLQGASAAVPELGLLMSPYLFNSYEEVDFVMDNYLLEAFDDLFAAKGLILLNWAEVGWTNLYAKRPLPTPKAAQGLKLRSSNALASQYLVQSIGADMVPMTFADIMPSLQTGLIDGGESGAIFYALTGLPKEAPHLTLTRHAFDTGMYLANREWFTGLSSEQQTHFKQSLMPTDKFRQLVRRYEQDILFRAEELEINVLEPSSAQLTQWQQATSKNRNRLRQSVGGGSDAINVLIDRALNSYRSAPTAR